MAEFLKLDLQKVGGNMEDESGTQMDFPVLLT